MKGERDNRGRIGAKRRAKKRDRKVTIETENNEEEKRE
jgi:hypothetical protein